MALLDYVPVIGPAIGGIASAFGQASANQANRDIAAQTNASNLAISREQMDFQERMSSSAWQRGVRDMTAAGINPLLAASQGGASSPPGAAVGSVTGAPMQSTMHGANQAAASAVQALRTKLDLDNLRATNRVLREDEQQKRSQIHLNNMLTEKAFQDSRVSATSAKNAGLAQSGLKVESQIDESKFGKVVRYLGRLNPFSNSAVNLSKIIK